MTQADVWNLAAVRKKIDDLLDRADTDARSLLNDHSGNGVPASVAVLFLLDQAINERIYGTVEISIKGTQVLSPRTTQSYRLTESYEECLR